MNPATTNFYVTGGTLRHDAPCYVVRQADRDLVVGLLQGEFCYVLTSRQMGKSSLMVRTALQLREQGLHVVALDLTAIGQNLTPEQWYAGLMTRLSQQLELEDELDDFWEDHALLGPCQRLFAGLRDVVLPALAAPPASESGGRLVIFVDEIDVVRSLPFSTDEFFAAIRECYNRRTEEAAFNRLTFCLLGVASPSDLIRDTRLTPFNVGRRIELNDFTPGEAAPLAQGLHSGPGAEARNAEALLERVLFWTSGHPYLTQRLCEAIVADRDLSRALDVDRLCEALFLERRAREQDDNLLFVRERLLRGEADPAGLLTLYSRVLRRPIELLLRGEMGPWHFLRSMFRRGHVPDDPGNRLVSVLRLSGIVRAEQGRLLVRNRIYAVVFDRRWVQDHMPDAEMRRQRAAFWLGVLRTTGVAIVVVAAMTFLAVYALEQSRVAGEAAERASRMSEENRWRTIRLNVAYGVRLMEEGDLLSSLQWFIEALRLAETDPARLDTHRARIGAVLRSCPKLERVWWHDSDVQHVEFSPNGDRILTAHGDGAARIWDASSGELVCPPLPHAQAINCACFSPDGRRIVTASGDATARVWDAETGQPVGTPLVHDAGVVQARFSPDGLRLATVCQDGAVRLWEAASGRPLASPTGHSDSVNWVAFSPAGRRLVTAGNDDTARVWDVDSGHPIGAPLRHQHDVVRAEFSPDGQRVVTASRDHSGRVWDAASGQPATPPLWHRTWLTDARFSPDGRTVLTTSFDSTARLWDVETGKPVCSPLRHSHSVMGGAFCPDGRRVITACFDQTAQVWDTATGERLLSPLKHSGYVSQALFSPDGHRILTYGFDRAMRLWDMAVAGCLVAPLEPADAVVQATFSADERGIVTGDANGVVRAWDAATGQPGSLVLPLAAPIRHVCFNEEGTRLLVTAGDNTAHVFDAITGRPVLSPLEQPAGLDRAVFSADGSSILASAQNGTARVWDASTGRPRSSLLKFTNAPSLLTFSRDGSRLLVVSSNRYAQVWNVSTGQPLSPPVEHPSAVVDAEFSPDGQRVVTSCRDDSLAKLWAQVWEAATGRLRAPPLRHEDGVAMASFSPDGSRIVTASEDGTAGIWDAHTGRLLAPLLRHSYQVYDAVFSPDGRFVATASRDLTARVWDGWTGEPVTPPLRHQDRVFHAVFSHTATRLITVTVNGRACVWNLAPETRTVEELTPLSQLLNSRQIDSSGAVLPIDTTRLEDIWHDLQSKSPADLVATKADLIAWRRAEAADCETNRRWFAAVHHLEHLVRSEPTNAVLRERLTRAQAALAEQIPPQPSHRASTNSHPLLPKGNE